MPHEVVTIDLSAGRLHTVDIDGTPHIVLRPAIEALGLSFAAQFRKLSTRSWGVVAQTATTGADGKTYDMAAVPVRTFLMLLATVNENRVSEGARPTLVAFQSETADAVEAYWTRGGAVNERASVEQVAALRVELNDVERASVARARLDVMAVAKAAGLVNASYIESMARHELARMTGQEPELDPQDITITCDEYLAERGVAKADVASARSRLGRTVAALYRARYGKDPQKITRPIHGVHREVAVYTHRDIDLFHTAWAEVGRRYDVQGDLASIEGAA
jgi:hypothetical protein